MTSVIIIILAVVGFTTAFMIPKKLRKQTYRLALENETVSVKNQKTIARNSLLERLLNMVNIPVFLTIIIAGYQFDFENPTIIYSIFIAEIVIALGFSILGIHYYKNDTQDLTLMEVYKIKYKNNLERLQALSKDINEPEYQRAYHRLNELAKTILAGSILQYTLAVIFLWFMQ